MSYLFSDVFLKEQCVFSVGTKLIQKHKNNRFSDFCSAFVVVVLHTQA